MSALLGERRPELERALQAAAAAARAPRLPRSLRPSDEMLTDSPNWARARPQLSVLIPYYGHDPRPLLGQLARQAALLGRSVEIVVLDDGDPEPSRGLAVARHIGAFVTPARLVRLRGNLGRSAGRNRLARHARGGHLLFLDSDMSADDPRFLARWLEAAQADVAVAFGGFTVENAPCPRTALHRALSRSSDCLAASVRRRAPEKHLATSNLLVRREVFETECFDEGFTGWGWEDVEWGLRVARRWPVTHLDNPAAHLGLDTPEALARKYRQSAANFARLARAHPQALACFGTYRAARLLRRLPLLTFWRELFQAMMLSAQVPLPLRVVAAKSYRAALHTEVV